MTAIKKPNQKGKYDELDALIAADIAAGSAAKQPQAAKSASTGANTADSIKAETTWHERLSARPQTPKTESYKSTPGESLSYFDLYKDDVLASAKEAGNFAFGLYDQNAERALHAYDSVINEAKAAKGEAAINKRLAEQKPLLVEQKNSAPNDSKIADEDEWLPFAQRQIQTKADAVARSKEAYSTAMAEAENRGIPTRAAKNSAKQSSSESLKNSMHSIENRTRTLPRTKEELDEATEGVRRTTYDYVMAKRIKSGDDISLARARATMEAAEAARTYSHNLDIIIWPTAGAEREFDYGWDNKYYKNDDGTRGTKHYAVDLHSYNGDYNIYSATRGTVEEVVNSYENSFNTYGSGSLKNAYGNYVMIKTDDGKYIIYAHMQKGSTVKAGDRVYPGTKLGLVGNTGNSLGKHLHFEVSNSLDEKISRDNRYVPPETYLPKQR